MIRDLATHVQELRTALGGQLGRALQRELAGVALRGEAMAKTNATTSPRVRSGTLRRSIVGLVREEGGAVVLALQAGREAEAYAGAQEYGATIRPRRGRFLAIPLGPMKTRAGVARAASPRDVPGLIFRPTARGGVLLRAKSKGKGARLEAVFALVREVRVPATRFLGRALDELRPEAEAAIHTALRRAVSRAD